MTKPIEESVNELILIESGLLKDPTIKAFEEATLEFNELLAEGLAQKRGSNIMSRDEAMRKAPSINQRPKQGGGLTYPKMQFNVSSHK